MVIAFTYVGAAITAAHSDSADIMLVKIILGK